MPTTFTNLEPPIEEPSAYKSVARAEATANFVSRNILREALTSKIANMIADGSPTKKITNMMTLLDKLQMTDPVSEKILSQI